MLGSAAGMLSGKKKKKKDSPICIEICIMSTVGSFGSSKGTVALWGMNHDMFSFLFFKEGFISSVCVCVDSIFKFVHLYAI